MAAHNTRGLSSRRCGYILLQFFFSVFNERVDFVFNVTVRIMIINSGGGNVFAWFVDL